MANSNGYQSQNIGQIQQQSMHLSQMQIRALSVLSMGTDELRELIYREVSENPALEIISDSKSKVPSGREFSNNGELAADRYQRAIENREDRRETLQAHLMHQLNLINLSKDEYELSQKLIYNLDKDGCYGSSISPTTLLDKTRPLQNKQMLSKCINRIQRMDPVGTCCRTLEESLFIQAKIRGDASSLTLFILDGHLELVSPPIPEKIIKKLIDFKKEWHSKKFAEEIPLDKIKLSEDLVEESVNYIRTLNPRPAQGYSQDTATDFLMPDVVLKVEKVVGPVRENNFPKGIVSGDLNYHFQVKYASGILPEIKILPEFSIDKENFSKAKSFLDILAFRESSMVLQCCAIVSAQKDFFLKGFEYLVPLTRREIAQEIGIHESTVSRFSNRKGSKFIQTEYGNLPISFFFSSGIDFSKAQDEERGDVKKVSSEVVKMKMQEIIGRSAGKISDMELTKILNDKGVKIARRTVAKYRNQLGIENSYNR